MQTLPAIAVAVGDSPVEVDLSGSSQPYKAVILYNASPLILGVTSGPLSTYLQPNTTLAVPASQSTGKVEISVVGSTTSATSGSVYPTVVWLNDQIPATLSSSPLTEVSLASGTTVDITGPVSVINQTDTVIGVGSDQAILYSNLAISESGTIGSSGTTTITLATIANSSIPPISSVPSPAHALAWIYSLAASSLVSGDQWSVRVVDANGHIYLQPGGQAYANGAFYTNTGTYSTSAEPVGYINDGVDLYVELVVEGTSGDAFTIAGSLTLVAYTSAIPPRKSIQELDYIYGGVLNEVNVIGALPRSTSQGIAIADSMAPADTVNEIQLTSNPTSFPAFVYSVILRSFSVYLSGGPGILTISGTSAICSCLNGDTINLDLYIAAGSTLQVAGQTAGNASITFTTLS